MIEDASGTPLTMMAVHAHPDDEASSTGGILAKYAAEGIRTVVVTCTNGELGDAVGKIKPGQSGHDEPAVVAHRRQELARSCELLAVSHLELLGYHDSGMMGWAQNEAPEAFWNTPVAEGAKRLAQLFDRYEPQVVVTYDANGFYGHPDHIQAHRITVAALELAPGPKKLYYPVVPRSAMARFAEAIRSAGIEPPPEDGDFDFGTPDDEITTHIDCSAVAETQFRALEAHGSQTDNAFFLGLGLELFKQVFAVEWFIRARDATGAPVPEVDLFAGLRPG
jgi:LmbE family N-acetylglucosaminyl deacetylase